MTTNQKTYSYSAHYLKQCKKHQREIDVDFVQWVNCVETQVIETLGYNLDDLPDEMYFGNFEKGMSSKDMADYVIKENCHLIINNVDPPKSNINFFKN